MRSPRLPSSRELPVKQKGVYARTTETWVEAAPGAKYGSCVGTRGGDPPENAPGKQAARSQDAGLRVEQLMLTAKVLTPIQ